MTTIRRNVAYAYGLAAYGLALATIVYAVAFLGNVVVPKTVDAGAGLDVADPVAVNLALLALFGLQHSLMARPWFKDRWTRLVPEPVERSTYVVFASLSLLVVMWGWRPLPAIVWATEGVVAVLLWGAYLGGWLLMIAATNVIDGDDLMGLRQVRAYRDGRELEPIDFQTPGIYRYVRNPIMTGFLLAFWITPRMTVGHLVFAGGMTGYVLVGVKLEERDLLGAYGDRYRTYRREVPLLVPRPWRDVPPPSEVADVDRGNESRTATDAPPMTPSQPTRTAPRRRGSTAGTRGRERDVGSSESASTFAGDEPEVTRG